MAEEKKKDGETKKPVKARQKKAPAGGKGEPQATKTDAKSAVKTNKPNQPNSGTDIAVKQKRSLVMFVAAVVLIAIIFIPGEMIWLWAHNAVRGFSSVTALFWPALLLFLAVATMLDKQIPKLWFRTGFTIGFVAALNAALYIYTYSGEIQVQQTFADAVQYKGGGLLGFVFGIPFLKLFGKTPAKILIIAVMIIVAFCVTNISIKSIYSFVIGKVSAFFDEQRRKHQKKKNAKNPVKVADDAFFDSDDDYDLYDLDDIDDDNDENNSKDADLDIDFDADDVDYEKKPKKKSKTKPKKKKSEDDISMPQSPVFSNDDNGEAFAEVIDFDDSDFDNSPKDEDIDYSIDIDIDSPMPMDEKREEEKKEDESKEEAINDLISSLFGESIADADTTDRNDAMPTASKVAKDISIRKNNPVKSTPEQKQYDPQTVPLDPPPKNRVRNRRKYPAPDIELLTPRKTKGSENAERELKENARKLIDTLESFSVGAKIVGYCRGPSITRYEIQPAPGVKISKITGLSDDIALNLAAEGVRMEAPIPGKPAIGIEIPNKTITPVTIRELIDSDEFQHHKSRLACVLGRDVAGKVIVMDLAKMPHLLIAGTTGSGKSVCVNGILMSLLFKATPEEVKLILIDPKLVEFSKYKGIPHLLVPVVSDAKKAAAALNWAVGEMEDRYKEFSVYNVKDVDSYNKMVAKNLETATEEELNGETKGEVVDGEFIPPKAFKKMPKIVIAIDELADLMMVAPNEVEESICRLAQKARAAGMHLVIATQRPSVNVITGVIKANIPSRISLKVASYVDSKTILDTGGGEKLIGRGDMLYFPVGMAKPLRVQGGYSSDDDIEAVTDFVKKHGSADYDEEISQEIERISQEEINSKGAAKDNGSSDDIDDSDPILEEAVKIVVDAGQASTSLLQRRLRLGYARAGRLIDTMEQMGIVGPHEGSKSRKVLLTPQQWTERQVTGAVSDE